MEVQILLVLQIQEMVEMALDQVHRQQGVLV
jgi:hypothetical protein